MPIDIRMPALSPTMEKGNLAKWLKKEGDAVKSGDVIAEIETDKATMEVEASDDGTLAKILVAAGTADVPVNQVIAVLAGDGEATWMATTPLLAAPVAGAGDCFSSLFLGHYLRRRDLPAALGAATSAMFAVLETTERLGTRELAIIAAQAELDPASPRFPARRIG